MRNFLIFFAILMAMLSSVAYGNDESQSISETGFVLTEDDGKIEVEYTIISTNPYEVSFSHLRGMEDIPSLDYEIPSTVTNPKTGIEYTVVSIGDDAFVSLFPSSSRSMPRYSKYYSLKSVSIPNTVRSIGDRAFERNSELKSIEIPESVKKLGCCVFMSCSSLESVKLPDHLEEIPDQAFGECKSLKTLDLPKECKTIGAYAFAFSGLNSIFIHENCEKIDDYAFKNTDVATVRLSANISEIGTAPWEGCKFLSAIEVDPDNQYYASLNGVLYNKEFTDLIFWPSDSEAEFVMPSTVKTICVGAILDKFSNEDLDFPEGIEDIRRGGIPVCRENTVTLPSTLKYISGYQITRAKVLQIKASTPPQVYREGINIADFFQSTFDNTVLEVGSDEIYRRYKLDPAWSKAFPNMRINNGLSGIDEVDLDEDPGSYEYFTVEGLRVQDPRPGQILIRRHNGKVEKIR